MANAAEDSTGYGGGAGGKFRKRPFKRAQTPYDRPVTALRNTSSSISNGGNNGWISKIVNPASKLISSSAHKLFSSVFRKRLMPPPPPREPSANNVESPENHLGDGMMDDCSEIQERDENEGVTQLGQERDKKEGEMRNSGTETDGVAELERILNQKTFTRSEIDHLSVLLQSRRVDESGTARQTRFELTPNKAPVGHFRQELDGLVCGNKVNPSEVPGADLTSAVRSKFNDEDIASPAELAKAYMGSRSTAVSPFTLGPRVQAVREENHALTRYQSHSPAIRTVQNVLSTPAKSQNELVIPRSRGRSALYSMSRTPYSRVLATETKDLVTSNGFFNGRSVAASQKVLKRRSSVLENDIRSVGPIRRIRQKSNLSYTKSLGQSSRTPLTHTTSEAGEASLYSSLKLQEDRFHKSKSVSSSHVSSESIEMGQRILQQLEKMTPPKEKSSDKKPGISRGIRSMESPAILLGQAHKSLETLDSLKSAQSGQVSGKIGDSFDTVLPREQDSTFKNQDKAHEITGNEFVNSSNKDKVHHENGDLRVKDNDFMGLAKNSAPVVLKSAVGEDVRSNGITSPLTNEGTVKSNGSLFQENPFLPEATKINGSVFPELKSSSNLFSKKNTAIEASTLAEGGIERSFQPSSVFNKEIEPSAPSSQLIMTSVSTNAGTPASAISFGLSSSDKVSQPSFLSSSVADSHLQLPNSAFPSASGATDVGNKSPESYTNGIHSVNLFKKSDSSPMSTSPTDTASKLTTGFQFGASTTPAHPPAGEQALPLITPSSPIFCSAINNSVVNQSGTSTTTTSSPIFGSAFNDSSSNPSFGASSSTPSNTVSPSVFCFGAPSPTSSSIPALSVFSFSATASAPTPSFGNGSVGANVFGSGYNNQTKMEDTMIEEPNQPSAANPVQSLGANPFQFSSQNQAPVSSANPFQFSSQQNQAPASSPFQFSSQQNQASVPFQFSSQQNQAPSVPNPFLGSDSSGGGSFSLGAGGGGNNDKSNRRIIKVRNRLRKK